MMSGVYVLKCAQPGCGYSDVRCLEKLGRYLCRYGRHGEMHATLLEYICKCKRFTGSSICSECSICRLHTKLSQGGEKHGDMKKYKNPQNGWIYYKCKICGGRNTLSSTSTDCMECYLRRDDKENIGGKRKHR